jgi:hypothetical protein
LGLVVVPGRRQSSEKPPRRHAGQSGANAFLVRNLLRHKNLAMTGRYVNQSNDPMRTLSDQVGERIAARLSGSPTAQVLPLKRGS